MTRSYPGGRRRRPGRPRRRPGRRPPNRYRGGPGPPTPQGFTPIGFRRYYELLLPDLRGREKREFFNGISLWIILGAGLGGVGIGYDWFGAFGAILGFGVGVMLGGWVCESERFYRP